MKELRILHTPLSGNELVAISALIRLELLEVKFAFSTDATTWIEHLLPLILLRKLKITGLNFRGTYYGSDTSDEETSTNYPIKKFSWSNISQLISHLRCLEELELMEVTEAEVTKDKIFAAAPKSLVYLRLFY